MRLSDRNKSSRTSDQQYNSGNDTQIRSATAYTRPISATLNGRPVTLIAFGDISGMSPAEKFIDEDGRVDWASSDDFVVDDQHIVPQSYQQRQRLQQNVSSGGTTTQRDLVNR